MHKYEIIVYWSEEDKAYVAEIPELPGCMADGKTYVEALKNAQVVISEWIETARSLGREIPSPKADAEALVREAADRGILEESESSRSTKLEAAVRLTSMKEDVPDWDEVEKLIALGHLNEG